MATSVFELEEKHLKFVIEKLDEHISKMSLENIALKMRVKEQNRLMIEQYGSAPGDFDQAVAFSQQLMMEKQMLEQKGMEDKQLEKYKNLKEKMYFARIDFKESNALGYEPIYIGYGNFMDHDTLDIFVYDWRTPIASVFYDFQTGPVYYKAPEETISGEVSLKRQFEIKNQTLMSVYDTKAHVVDDKLLEVLAGKTAGQMGQIVETIQAEQNKIIREQKASVLFVEGIAGSGKTVVALHRIAYLMYHGLKSHLSAHQVLIVSPNDLFSDYIAGVIPELGENQVLAMTFEDIVLHYLPFDVRYESRYERLERRLDGTLSAQELASDAIKESENMARLLEAYVADYVNHGIQFVDIYYGDTLLSTGNAMAQMAKEEMHLRPLLKRLEKIKERVKFLSKEAEEIHYKRILKKIKAKGNHPFDYKTVARLERMKLSQAMNEALKAMADVSAKDIYKSLVSSPDFWLAYFDEKTVKNVCHHTLKALEANRLSAADLHVLAYIQVLISGERTLKDIRHIVVDESQDYSLFSYALMKKLFKDAHFTILGDAHQTLQGIRMSHFHTYVDRALGIENAVHANLTVGYRNVKAIGALCLSLFKGEQGYQMVEREGEKPRVFDSLDKALAHLKTLKMPSIAVITKTMKRARAVHQSLSLHTDAVLIHEHTKKMKTGLVVLPVYMAKGMEFDAVVVMDADEKTYLDERDRQLLYVCASRALHHLCFVKGQDLSPLLDTGFLFA